MSTLAPVFVIVIALAFDFTNGFHDAANSIATVASTPVLTPRLAVIRAAFRWDVAGPVVWTWILTIPGGAFVGAAVFGVIHLIWTVAPPSSSAPPSSAGCSCRSPAHRCDGYPRPSSSPTSSWHSPPTSRRAPIASGAPLP